MKYIYNEWNGPVTIPYQADGTAMANISPFSRWIGGISLCSMNAGGESIPCARAVYSSPLTVVAGEVAGYVGAE
jgi:hypothetical protein